MDKLFCPICQNFEDDLTLYFFDYRSAEKKFAVPVPPYFIFRLSCGKCQFEHEVRISPKDLIKEID